MKTKISDNGDYAVFAELKPLENQKDIYCLSFSSLLKSANNVEEQNKFQMFITKDNMETLKGIL